MQPVRRSARSARHATSGAVSKGPLEPETSLRRVWRDPVVQTATHVAQLSANAGDLLAHEPGGEEDAAEDEAGLDDGPHPALAEAGDEERDQRGETGERADREE